MVILNIQVTEHTVMKRVYTIGRCMMASSNMGCRAHQRGDRCSQVFNTVGCCNCNIPHEPMLVKKDRQTRKSAFMWNMWLSRLIMLLPCPLKTRIMPLGGEYGGGVFPNLSVSARWVADKEIDSGESETDIEYLRLGTSTRVSLPL